MFRGDLGVGACRRFENSLIIDFETVPEGDLYHIGAVLNNTIFERKKIQNAAKALAELSVFSEKANFVLGHNIVNHDLRVAKKLLPEASFLNLPVIDTLFLSPLAFPENPYHKLIKDYKLLRTGKNNPVSDARLAGSVFDDQLAAFSELYQKEPDILSVFSFAFASYREAGKFEGLGIFEVFNFFSGGVPDSEKAKSIFQKIGRRSACKTGLDDIWERCALDPLKRPMLAYVLSWLRVSGGNSIIPPWVKHEFPELSGLIRKIRFACGNDDCDYCTTHNDSEKLLKRFFSFDEYRALADGRMLQKEIIDASLSGQSLLGILPTGGGKSICYQIPALQRYVRLGELTIVISPLKALMKDQVDNLNRETGMEAAAAINGSLTLPERGAVMEKVRLGDVGILYVSPEQLRNYSVAELIKSRDVGCWVFDEAHCLSKWGHDFRPDYLHVAEFISAYSNAMKRTPLVGAFTATAKKDVIEEIFSHFEETLGLSLSSFMGGVQRDNLHFQVWPVTKNEKYDVIANCLKETMAESSCGAIVYCATRGNTEKLSAFLNEQNIPSQPFHAGRSEPDKRNIQDEFIAGKIPVICATNAFGMGIDKKDIRLVIHADTPGSLENYLQEAGRAGRDLAPSDCILLYEQEDIEGQFSLAGRSRLSFKDIRRILSILKKRGARAPDIVITPGEIMRLIGYRAGSDDDTRARIGVSWLERKGFLKRSFNQTLFFTGTPIVKDVAEAEKKIDSLNMSRTMKAIYLTIINSLFNADRDKVLSADEICSSLGKIENLPDEYLDSRHVIRLLNDMANAGLVREGIVMTAFIRPKGKGNALGQLSFFSEAEKQMLKFMEELSPDAGQSPEVHNIINLRLMSQRLKDAGFEDIHSDTVERLLRAMAVDKGENQGKSIKISGRNGLEQQRVYVKFSWYEIRKRVKLRHEGARACIEAITQCLPRHLQAGQAQVMSEFFISDIIKVMHSDLFLSAYRGDIQSLIEKCLLYLHDLKIITLQSGLGVFRQAMTISLLPESEKRRYTKGDYEPLSHHYAQKNVQVHVMEKYAHLGLEKIKNALGFVSDYFSSSYDNFISKYFSDQKNIIETAMTADAYKRIIQSLENTIQESIVASPPEKNILVLAGPGSGKTRTIVHRCAWLIRAKSADPSSILILCFNHQAMIEIRKRIKLLAGRLADGVTALTYHGFAMRLTGRSLLERSIHDNGGEKGFCFDTVIEEATQILLGESEIGGLESHEARNYLLAKYRYILVDEYQDIDEGQYRFISALTGRLENDKDSKINIMAVGDDDQSIYAFRDANVKFIKRFKEDYAAETFYLLENYRSEEPVISVSNALIGMNKNRMKTDKQCRVNKKRAVLNKNSQPARPENRVQVVKVSDCASQAVFVADTIRKLLKENPDTRPEDIAVISRQGIRHPYLVALRMALAKEDIEFCYSLKSSPGFPILRVREIQALIGFLSENTKLRMHPEDLKQEIMKRFNHKNSWSTHVEQLLDAWCQITPDMEISLSQAKAFIMETLLEERREHKTGKGVFMGTVHSVKGMEFPYVFILDGGWTRKNQEEERRLYYVGMTRAERSLFLCHLDHSGNTHIKDLLGHPMVEISNASPMPLHGFSEDLTISILGMEDLFISFAGKFPKSHAIHGRLSDLQAGDTVRLKEQGGKVHITNLNDEVVSTLSRKATSIWKNNIPSIITGRVLAVVKRDDSDGENDGTYKTRLSSWELPIVEVLHKKIGMKMIH